MLRRGSRHAVQFIVLHAPLAVFPFPRRLTQQQFLQFRARKTGTAIFECAGVGNDGPADGCRRVVATDAQTPLTWLPFDAIGVHLGGGYQRVQRCAKSFVILPVQVNQG